METIIPRLFTPPKQSFFLFGPRGTGKSTWLKAHMPDAIWIDLLEADQFRSYSARPERLKELVLAETEKKIVVIDEIQKVPDLLTVVHSLIEKKLKLRFILTGSSPRKLKKTGTDLLAGRVIRQALHPFMAVELGRKFNLILALKEGLLPLVFSAAAPEAVLRTYASLYVREEVQAEGLVRNIGNFSRFLEAASFSHGSLLNTSNVARDCEVERKTVEAYMTILEDLLLAYRIPVFSKKAKRATVAHPKFYYFDAGVYRSLRPRGPLDRPEEIEGAALEGLVAQHLTAWNSYRGEKNKVYFWRTAAGSEVDFVVYGEEVFWAIEVKNTSRIRPEDLRSLRSFKSEYPQSIAFLLYRGKERLKKGDVLCIPCDEFLLNLSPEKIQITYGVSPGH
ncbi:MAG TPA: AAA family ATPase [Candidatus Omnitrophota bacterium]|nr:AAA family ATPase [Candidatus Omnitrophota bacterium]